MASRVIIAGDACSYAANVEQAELRAPEPPSGAGGEVAKVATPGAKTIEQVTAHFTAAKP